MGTIKADTVTGLADPNKLTVPKTVTVGATILTDGSAGSTTITGEGGSTTTNLQQGLVKHWVQATDDTTFRDTFNAGSGTDNGTGNYTYTFTNNMSNDDYACCGLPIHASPRMANITAIATGSYTIKYHNPSAEARDVDNCQTVHGDLA